MLAASVSLNGIRAADTEANAVINLINKLREDQRFQCPIVVMAESAPGIEASQIERMLRLANISGVCVMCELAGYKEGVPKTAKSTELMLFALQRAMLPGPGGVAKLCWWDELITWSIDDVPPEKWPSKIRKKMREQMNNLRKVVPTKTREYGDTPFKITAKINGTPDDLLVALETGIHWRDVFWANERGQYSEVQDMINSIVYHHY